LRKISVICLEHLDLTVVGNKRSVAAIATLKGSAPGTAKGA